MKPPELIFNPAPSPRDLKFLDDRLMDFNGDKIQGYGYRDFVFSATDDRGATIAGIHGTAGSGWLYIVSLWVADAFRSRGLGKRLLAAAENKGREMGCHSAYLFSYTFQNPGFYEKRGYGEFGRLDDFCGDQAKVYLKKRLAD